MRGRKRRETTQDALRNPGERAHSTSRIRVVARDSDGTVKHLQDNSNVPSVDDLVEDIRSKIANLDSEMSDSGFKVVYKGSGSKVRSWTFSTNRIIQSGDLERGAVRVSSRIASNLNVRPGVRVFVRYGARSVTAALKPSESLIGTEVELNGEDLEALGISEGAFGYLEIVSDKDVDRHDILVREDSGRRGTASPRKVKMPVGRLIHSDNSSPPYIVESGYKFWKRRKRV